MKTCLTIAGSDSSGGAGIQADLKTMTVNGVYAMSVITALTAQNTQGVTGILDVSPEFITEQMDAVFNDIYPDAIKIGMVSSPEIVEAIAASLEKYQAKNIVLDPVMVATSGAKLLKEEAMDSLINRLIPLADVITPNIPEGEILAGMEITNEDQMIKAAEEIGKKYDCAVLLKGGHRVNDANDLLYRDGEFKWFRSERIDNPNTHGTGCTLSSAIGANLAKGYDIDQAIEKAKDYLTGALRAGLDLGKGSGPLMHNYKII
ncbi:bifunctional hydroxymethylpyrimidine kinase/phosphomethylpyrimidine kinase [uncultured Anaerococcus sp.]|uniref:bifunctional hydroxymethylpyrimidine kinase/phosphomethylpyrimidine kinase n=1 Tax=uncultured Anaerococcus sp. TaxID=293428 RepID=UPI00288990EE|nr:bifunctional hydroxymethylpyrimidine kinase/phosphomethylpyrimidine kinase [uncultured Anaerococcus sp.]